MKKSNIKKALIAYKKDLALGKVSTAQLVTVVDQDENYKPIFVEYKTAF